jgi:hypothetical protein
VGRSARQTALLLLGSCAALALPGCSGGASSGARPAGLRLEREDLIAVARALNAVEREVQAEVSATKAAWPAVADGLPRRIRSLRPALIRTAARRATALRTPGPLGAQEALSLTGPAAGVAGLFRGFATLSGRGWHLIGGAIEAVERGSPASARFARANVALYIESVYDAHFGLAQVGRRLRSAYEELGGGAAFGSALPRAEVERLAAVYSEAHDRLHPHPGVKLGS